MAWLYPFETLIIEAEEMGIWVYEESMPDNMPGLYCDGVICIENRLSYFEKNCIMAEEIGHHLRSVGNIIDQKSVSNRKQELLGREYAYVRLMPPSRLLETYRCGCYNVAEISDYLDITEDFFADAVQYYTHHIGIYTLDGYVIIFDSPSVRIYYSED